MKHSEKTDLIDSALAAAQGNITSASKTGNNPHFHSRYSTLDAVYDACRKALADEGIAVIQASQHFTEGRHSWRLVTRIVKEQQWYEDDGIPLMSLTESMQGYGSALTYARRYGLSAMVGVAPDDETDDDGNAASAGAKATPPPPRATRPTEHSVRGTTPAAKQPASQSPPPAGNTASESQYSRAAAFPIEKFQTSLAAKNSPEEVLEWVNNLASYDPVAHNPACWPAINSLVTDRLLVGMRDQGWDAEATEAVDKAHLATWPKVAQYAASSLRRPGPLLELAKELRTEGQPKMSAIWKTYVRIILKRTMDGLTKEDWPKDACDAITEEIKLHQAAIASMEPQPPEPEETTPAEPVNEEAPQDGEANEA